MAYVTLEFLSSELLERAVQAVTRSRELCANTSRRIKEMRDGIVAVQGTDRQLETVLRERQRVSARVSGTLRVHQVSSSSR